MTDRNDMDAREAVNLYHAVEGDAFESMHAVLAKHECDVRKRIVDEIESLRPTQNTSLNSEYNRALDDAVIVVTPPEPTKPVTCKNCGHPVSDERSTKRARMYSCPGCGCAYVCGPGASCPQHHCTHAFHGGAR